MCFVLPVLVAMLSLLDAVGSASACTAEHEAWLCTLPCSPQGYSVVKIGIEMVSI